MAKLRWGAGGVLGSPAGTVVVGSVMAVCLAAVMCFLVAGAGPALGQADGVGVTTVGAAGAFATGDSVVGNSAESPAVHYYAVDFVDGEQGWVGGITYVPPGLYGFEDTGIIGHTGSGGRSWEYCTSHVAGEHLVGWNFRTVTSLDFVDALRGWAVLDDGTILFTADGGTTWTSQAEGSFEYRDNNWSYSSISMADSAHGCAAGSWVGLVGVTYPRVVYTSDGVDWKQAELPELPGRALQAVHMADPLHGWAVGTVGPDDQMALVLSTDDGGATWRRQTVGIRSDGNSLRGVCFVDVRHGWAVGDSGVIYASADGGQTWWSQTSGTSSDLTGVGFADLGVGWAVGDNGTLLETVTAGLSWEAQSSGTEARLRGVASAAGRAWFVGDEGVILHRETPASQAWPPFFSDVGQSPYKTAIESLALGGVVRGFPSGEFRPAAPLTRAQFAKMLIKVLDLDPGLVLPGRFTDLGAPDADGYPHRYVQAAYELGIIKGVDSGQTRFAPWSAVLRGQATTMVTRAMTVLAPGAVAPQLTGDPSQPLSRGEAAQLLYDLKLAIAPTGGPGH